MIKLIGIINLIFFFSAVVLLVLKNKWFTIKKYTISDLASSKKTGKLFNISLFIFSINQVIFAILVYHSLSSYVNNLALPLFVIGGLFLCIASLYSTNKYPRVHEYSAIISGLTVGLGVILLAFGLIKINIVIGTFVALITCLIPLVFLYRNHFSGGMFEIPLFAIVSLWNITLSLYLFNLY